MSTVSVNTSREAGSESDQRRLVVYVYGFQLLGLLLVFPAILGLGINYARRQAVRAGIYPSHFAWQIRTVWWMVGWWLVSGGLVLATNRLGPPVYGIAGALIFWLAMLWLMYRLLRGYLALCRGHPMPV